MTLQAELCPETLTEYGNTEEASVGRNFIESWQRGHPLADALLLHGPPGVGKTTLVRCLARSYGLEMVDWDASSDVDRDTIPVMYRAALSASWNGDPKIVFVDEVEHITTTQQQRIADIIDASRHPVILACNHYGDVHESVKDACMTIEFGPPKTRALERLAKRINDREALPGVSAEDVAEARSFRQLLGAACGGSVGVARADDFDARIRQLLRGEDVDLRPSEYWLAKAWLLDNSNGTPAGEYDRWLARYRDVGSSMEKYIKRAVRQVQRRCRQPRFPWSVTIQGKSDDEEDGERDADDEGDEDEEGASGIAASFF